jgi:hypothetical protein
MASSWFQEGVDAFTIGVSIKCNPYAKGEPGQEWADGWVNAFYKWSGKAGRGNHDKAN